MTKKRYPKTARVSRSAPGRRPPGRLPQPVEPGERPLTRNAFRNLDPSIGDDPVAAMVHRMPDVRAARGHLARAAKRLRKCPQDRTRFIAYDDAWTEYCVLCEERYFNLGFEHGTRAGVGMAMGNIAANMAVMRSITRTVHAAVLAPGNDHPIGRDFGRAARDRRGSQNGSNSRGLRAQVPAPALIAGPHKMVIASTAAPAPLSGHVRRALEFTAGRWRPGNMTDGQQRAFLDEGERFSPGHTAWAGEILDGYDIGGTP